MSKVFTSGEAAALCNVAPRTVAKWIDSGRLRGYRLPGSMDRRVPRDELLRFMRAHGLPTAELEGALSFSVVLVGAEGLVAGRLRDLLPGADGWRVEAAASVFAAGGLVAAVRPDAVAVDLGVGRSDGLAIAAALRREEALAGLHLAALASEDETDPGGLRAGGFDAVLKKPFDPRELAAALAAHRAAREARPLTSYSGRSNRESRKKALAGRQPLRLAQPSA